MGSPVSAYGTRTVPRARIVDAHHRALEANGLEAKEVKEVKEAKEVKEVKEVTGTVPGAAGPAVRQPCDHRAGKCHGGTEEGASVTETAAAGTEDFDPDEHVRFARYRRAFADVAPEDAAALAARVLTDPERSMASCAVCEYLDRRAAELLTDPGFPAWRRELADVVAADAFAVRRLRDWALLRAMTLDEPWEEEQLLAAENWLQAHLAEKSPAVPVLSLLAESGRTRRSRNIASSRLRQLR
ncbi:hypothetical protein [Streptomyces sp. LS1784]|uniref:hypothetical protein n=1 Tax=Streptomyces sp. LS1784 TaxID=2851533 RepID=UPI001CCB0CF0|nr:hypothetical protein [Streptomyces sp. LS1784]